MTPNASQVLVDLAARVAANAAPDVHPAARAGELSLSALLLGLLAQMWDGAAERLTQENRALRALLSEGAGLWGETAQGRWLGELARGVDADLKISTLEAANAELKVGLIALHAEVERRTDPAARALEAKIWSELAAGAERRKLAGSPV